MKIRMLTAATIKCGAALSREQLRNLVVFLLGNSKSFELRG